LETRGKRAVWSGHHNRSWPWGVTVKTLCNSKKSEDRAVRNRASDVWKGSLKKSVGVYVQGGREGPVGGYNLCARVTQKKSSLQGKHENSGKSSWGFIQSKRKRLERLNPAPFLGGGGGWKRMKGGYRLRAWIFKPESVLNVRRKSGSRCRGKRPKKTACVSFFLTGWCGTSRLWIRLHQKSIFFNDRVR